MGVAGQPGSTRVNPVLVQAFGLHSKALSALQIAGASLTILGGVAYGKARQAIEEEAGMRGRDGGGDGGWGWGWFP